jgi:hypothetical protein
MHPVPVAEPKYEFAPIIILFAPVIFYDPPALCPIAITLFGLLQFHKAFVPMHMEYCPDVLAFPAYLPKATLSCPVVKPVIQ